MPSSNASSAAATGGATSPAATLSQQIRAAWRLLRLGLLLGQSLAIVALLFPRASSRQRQAWKHRWSRKLLRAVGVRTDAVVDIPPSGAALIVSNHISWLDIFVLNALTHTHFVCKDEVRAWPVIGWLVEHTGTVFIERGSRSAAARTAQTINARLARGEQVALFPEGTTTDGTRILPFRAALFQPAIDSAVPVMPVALRYVDADGQPSFAPAYDGDITFWQCLRAIVQAPAVHARVEFLPPLSPDIDRRALASCAEAAIGHRLGLISIPEPLEEAA